MGPRDLAAVDDGHPGKGVTGLGAEPQVGVVVADLQPHHVLGLAQRLLTDRDAVAAPSAGVGEKTHQLCFLHVVTSAGTSSALLTQGVALQVAHRLEGRVVRLVAGAAHAVGDDPYDVVPLMRVDERVVDADVGQHADEHEGTDPQPAQNDVEVGAVEDRVAAFLDQVLVGTRHQLGDDLGARRAQHAVDALAAVELAADVDEVGPVHLLRPDHRQPGGAEGLDHAGDAGDPLVVPAHLRDAGLVVRLPAALLDVDHEQGAARDQDRCHDDLPRVMQRR